MLNEKGLLATGAYRMHAAFPDTGEFFGNEGQQRCSAGLTSSGKSSRTTHAFRAMAAALRSPMPRLKT